VVIVKRGPCRRITEEPDFWGIFFDRGGTGHYYSRPMLQRLPEHIDPLRFAQTGRELEGEILPGGMQRLRKLLSSDVGTVRIRLVFDLDDAGNPRVQGSISATLEVLCQRCMAPMPLSLETRVLLGIVTTEAQANALPDDYEPLLVGSEEVSLTELVEDELLLALPLTALHEQGQCLNVDFTDHVISDEPQARENPFSVLAGLKRSSNGKKQE